MDILCTAPGTKNFIKKNIKEDIKPQRIKVITVKGRKRRHTQRLLLHRLGGPAVLPHVTLAGARLPAGAQERERERVITGCYHTALSVTLGHTTMRTPSRDSLITYDTT